MRISVYAAVFLAGVLALGSPWLAARQSPHVAVRLLAGSGIAAAAATWWGLMLLVGTLLAGEPRVGARTGWTPRTWSALDPVPHIFAVVAAAGLLAVTLRVAAELRRQITTRRAAADECRHATSELVVHDCDDVYAYAVPGRDPHIVASSAMLRLLNTRQRRALLAHERSHLRHRHDLYLFAGRLSAALNPLLTRHRDDIAYLCERWADEDAAEHLGDRTLVAGSLACASVAVLGARGQLGFERLGVRHRLAALASERPPNRPLTAAVYAALALIPLLAASDATVALWRIVEAAQG